MATSRRRLLARLLAGAAASGAAASFTACVGESPPARVQPPGPVLIMAENTPGRSARVDSLARRLGASAGPRPLVFGAPGQPAPPNRPAPAGQLLAALAADPTVAHIVWHDHLDLPLLAARRALVALDGYVRRDRYDLKRFMPAGLQSGYSLDGRLCSLPSEVDARQLYFNRAHFRARGVDFRRAGFDFERPAIWWEALRATNLDLLSASGGSGPVPFHPGHVAAPLEQWGWQNGGEWLADGGRRAAFVRPENGGALEWLAAHARELGRLFAADSFPPPARDGGARDEGGRHPFITGRVSICVESTRFVSTFAGAEPEFALGYVELPRRHPGWPVASAVDAAGYALIRGAPDRAWDVLRNVVGEDAAVADALVTSRSQRVAPPRPADALPAETPVPGRVLWYPAFTGQLAIDRRLADTYRTGSKLLDEGRDHGLEQLRHGRRRAATIAPHAVWPLLESARRAALAGTRSPTDALRDAQEQAQALLDDAWASLGK